MPIEGLSEEAATADNADQPGPFTRLVIAEWQTLLDKDDRTSPAEYPEMCLITRVELASAMAEAWVFGRDAALNLAARAEGPAPPGGGVLDGKLGNTPTREVLRIAALMLDEAAQRLGGLVDMPVVAKKLRELSTKGADHG